MYYVIINTALFANMSRFMASKIVKKNKLTATTKSASSMRQLKKQCERLTKQLNECRAKNSKAGAAAQ